MKYVLSFFFFLCLTIVVKAQSAINSSANSNNELIFSVGELFVVPVNDNEISSGGIGSLSIIEFNALSLEEIVATESFKFYPNPTSDVLFLETRLKDLESVWIYDTNGQLILQKSIVDHKVDLSMLQAGTYFVKLNNNNTQTFKIIKK